MKFYYLALLLWQPYLISGDYLCHSMTTDEEMSAASVLYLSACEKNHTGSQLALERSRFSEEKRSWNFRGTGSRSRFVKMAANCGLLSNHMAGYASFAPVESGKVLCRMLVVQPYLKYRSSFSKLARSIFSIAPEVETVYLKVPSQQGIITYYSDLLKAKPCTPPEALLQKLLRAQYVPTIVPFAPSQPGIAFLEFHRKK